MLTSKGLQRSSTPTCSRGIEVSGSTVAATLYFGTLRLVPNK